MDSPTAIWVDGLPAEALPLPDRGLDFGDGLFETLLLRQGTPLFPERHLARLAHGLATLGFPACRERAAADLATVCADVTRRSWSWASLRLTVTRGCGPRGYAPPPVATPRLVVAVSPLARDCGTMLAPARLALSPIPWPTQPLLAGLKHLNRLEQVLAAAALGEHDEAVMLNQDGRPVSVTAGNLFMVQGKSLLTPPIAGCGIDGTRRRLVLEQWAPAVGLRAREAAFSVAELQQADEVFYTSSLVGLRPVASLPGRRWQRYDVSETLFARYREALR